MRDKLYKLPNYLGYLSSLLNSFGFRTINILLLLCHLYVYQYQYLSVIECKCCSLFLPGAAIDILQASRTGILGLVLTCRYSGFIWLKLVTTMHSSWPNCLWTWNDKNKLSCNECITRVDHHEIIIFEQGTGKGNIAFKAVPKYISVCVVPE